MAKVKPTKSKDASKKGGKAKSKKGEVVESPSDDESGQSNKGKIAHKLLTQIEQEDGN